MISLAAILSSCEGDGLDVLDVEVPADYALSAGTSTIFPNSSKAYDAPADWVSGEYNIRFNRGDKLYDDMRTSSNNYGGGLGPVYAGYSCGSCHSNAGRTKPAIGPTVARALTDSPRCWYTSPVRTGLSLRIMDV